MMGSVVNHASTASTNIVVQYRDWGDLDGDESFKAIRIALKMTKPDDFEYIVDKTICLMKGIPLWKPSGATAMT